MAGAHHNAVGNTMGQVKHPEVPAKCNVSVIEELSCRLSLRIVPE